MPIKASYCDAFYEACKNDLFCGHGNFFECARVNPDNTMQNTTDNREKYLQEEALLRQKYLEEEALLTKQKSATAVLQEQTTAMTETSSAYMLGLVAHALLS
jgi:hypothetical protein